MPLTGCDAPHEGLQQAPNLVGCENAVTAAMSSYDGPVLDSRLPSNACMCTAPLLSATISGILDAG